MLGGQPDAIAILTVRPAAASPRLPSGERVSSSVSRLETVLTIRDTLPSSMMSRTLGRLCPILPTAVALIPAALRAAAVPAVA